MKVFLFSLILFSTIIIDVSVRQYSKFKRDVQRKIFREISESTVALYSKKTNSYGSGFVIKKSNKKYILTNSHVCDKTDHEELEEWEIASTFVETFFVRNKHKIDNKSMDYCFMEYMGTIPAYDLKRKKRIFKIADLILDQKEMYHFTRNRTEGLRILKRKAYFGSYKPVLEMKNLAKNKKVVKYHSVVLDKLAIVSGDSGSPILDNLGNYKGQVFGHHKPDESKKEEYEWHRSKEEKKVSHGYATRFEIIQPSYNGLK